MTLLGPFAATLLRRNGGIIAQRPYRLSLIRCRRSISISPPAGATPYNLSTFTSALQKTAIFQKIADHPQAIAALQEFACILQRDGIDLTCGQPSVFKIMKLAANSDFKNAMKRVSEELQKAGIDISSPEVMNELLSLRNIIEKPT